MRRVNRLLALVLSAAMITGSLPVSVMADENMPSNDYETVIVEQEEQDLLLADEEAEAVSEDTDLPDGIAGMPEGYELSAAEVRIKNDMIDSDVLSELGKMTSGVDYFEDEVICFAYNEEHARQIAEAYSGELLEYSYGVARISLAESIIDVTDAVGYGLDTTLGIPAVEPNYIYHLVEPEDTESSAQVGEDELLSLEYRSDWDRVYNGVLKNPDPMLNPESEKYQWHHQAINTYNAWAVTTGTTDITVAVIDSGYTPGHPDISAERLVSSELDV